MLDLDAMVRVFALGLIAGCSRREYTIPPRDGPLALEVRYPTAAPVAVTDSISLWGAVGSGKALLDVNGQTVRVEPNGGFAAFLPLPPGDSPVLELVARKGKEQLRRSIRITRPATTPAPASVLHPARGWVRLRRLPSDTADSATEARPVYARWTPGGALALPLPLGVRLPVEVETDSAVRVRLSRDLVVWVARSESEPTTPPSSGRWRVSGLTLAQTAGRSVITLDAPEFLASTVEVIPGRARWILFGARAESIKAINSPAGLVGQVQIRDLGDGRVLVTLSLRGPLLGWRTLYRERRAVLELRPTRVATPSLEGLVVALDPGHPPEGAIGPTGLREDSVTLAVALEAAARLRALGARPVLTRSDAEPVSLELRVARAEAADADLLVSIHVNAPGDGRPPWSVDGTRIYWWHPQSFELAKGLRDSVPVAMSQQRVGTIQSNLAVLRPTWFPAALVEATALTLPVREAYLRSPAGIAAYAAGIVGGIQGWANYVRSEK